MIYTGIGSRKILPGPGITHHGFMKYLAKLFSMKGLTLRSGGAIGADTAFESGCDLDSGKKEIFLHKRRVGQRTANGVDSFDSTTSPCWKEAHALAKRFHPFYKTMSQNSRDLHARNVFQVLGWEMNNPTDFVVFGATPVEGSFGLVEGGTNTAVQIAKANGIPTFNLLISEEIKDFEKFMRERALL